MPARSLMRLYYALGISGRSSIDTSTRQDLNKLNNYQDFGRWLFSQHGCVKDCFSTIFSVFNSLFENGVALTNGVFQKKPST